MPSNGSPEYLALLADIEQELLFDPPTSNSEQGWKIFDQEWELMEHGSRYFDLTLYNSAILAIDLYSKINKMPVDHVITQMRELHIRKNAGYAGHDQPDPWANFRLSTKFGIAPADGVLVRLSDKYIRTVNLRRDPRNEQVGESLLDSLADYAAYALIAICLMEEANPE